MEPFGLAAFLKSILTPPQKTESAPPPIPTEEAPTEPVPQPPPPKPNACVGFFEAHDRRAKKTKGR